MTRKNDITATARAEIIGAVYVTVRVNVEDADGYCVASDVCGVRIGGDVTASDVRSVTTLPAEYARAAAVAIRSELRRLAAAGYAPSYKLDAAIYSEHTYSGWRARLADEAGEDGGGWSAAYSTKEEAEGRIAEYARLKRRDLLTYQW